MVAILILRKVSMFDLSPKIHCEEWKHPQNQYSHGIATKRKGTPNLGVKIEHSIVMMMY